MRVYIVKIEDEFAIRRDYFLLGREYKDLKTRTFWWGKGSKYFGDCLGSIEEVEEELKLLLSTDKIVRRVL